MVKIKFDKISSGDRLELAIYPTHKSGKKLPEGPKSDKTPEQMQAENDRRAALKFVRLSAANFTDDDFIISCEYDPQYAPENPQMIHKDIANYIKRIKYLREKKGLSNKDFKYNIAIHCEKYKSGLKKGLNHYHFHGFITGGPGIDIREIKNLWRYGTSGKVDYYDPDHNDPDGFAWYAATGSTKQKNSIDGKSHMPKGTRKYVHSQNCKQPKIEPKKDAKLNKDKLADLAEKRVDDRDYWEKRYPAYNFVKMDAVYNEINGYYYVNVLMYKRRKKKKSYYEKSKKACAVLR